MDTPSGYFHFRSRVFTPRNCPPMSYGTGNLSSVLPRVFRSISFPSASQVALSTRSVPYGSGYSIYLCISSTRSVSAASSCSPFRQDMVRETAGTAAATFISTIDSSRLIVKAV